MKNLILSSLVLFFFASCASDDSDPIDQQLEDNTSLVYADKITWSINFTSHVEDPLSLPYDYSDRVVENIRVQIDKKECWTNYRTRVRHSSDALDFTDYSTYIYCY